MNPISKLIKQINLVSFLLLLFCLFLGWKALQLSKQLEAVKGEGQKDILKISDLSKQLDSVQTQLLTLGNDRNTELDNLRLEDDNKIKSFAYQALICDELRKKLKM